jgi:hypothetical protein
MQVYLLIYTMFLSKFMPSKMYLNNETQTSITRLLLKVNGFTHTVCAAQVTINCSFPVLSIFFPNRLHSNGSHLGPPYPTGGESELLEPKTVITGSSTPLQSCLHYLTTDIFVFYQFSTAIDMSFCALTKQKRRSELPSECRQ